MKSSKLGKVFFAICWFVVRHISASAQVGTTSLRARLSIRPALLLAERKSCWRMPPRLAD